MISVIIPVYNDEEYLHVCINSVINQTYSDLEIICVDDDSSDSSYDILQYFAKKDDRIKVLKNEHNKGLGYNRNRGMEVATGKYVSFLDSDDWISPDTFEVLIEKAEKENLDVLIYKSIVFYEDTQNFGFERYYDMEFMDKWESKVFNHWDLDKTKLFSIPVAAWNKLYLKSFLDENDIRFPNENLIHEDNPFYCKMITSAERISILNKYFHNRRRRSGSIMTWNNERLFDNISIVYRVLDVFLNEPKLYEYYKKEVLFYIFVAVLDAKYEQIDEQFKDQFYDEVVKVYNDLIENYGLYDDILESVWGSVLRKFKII